MPDARAPSPALLAVLAAAIAAGAAASLLAATAPVFQPATGPTVLWQPPPWVLGLLLLSPLLAVIVGTVLRRLTQVHQRAPNRVILFVAVMAALAVAFIAFAVLFGHAASSGGLSSSTPTGPTTNNTTGPPQSGGTGSSGVFPHLTPWGLPGWLPIAVFTIAALALVGFVVPALYHRSVRRAAAPPPSAATRQAAENALRAAAARLDHQDDPRGVVIELYVQLLRLVSPLAGDLDPRTASEIRDEQLVPLGVRRDAAEQLTQLFEEARYSTHPLGREAVAGARAALQAALWDLGRVAPLA